MSKAQKGWKRGFWVIEDAGIIYLFDGKETVDPRTGGKVAAKKPTKKDLPDGDFWFRSDLKHGPLFDHVAADLRSLLAQLVEKAGQKGPLFIHLLIDLTADVPVAVVSE